MRFLLIPFIFAAILQIVTGDGDRIQGAIVLLVSLGLYFLFTISRRLQYDDQNFYIIRGSNERAIHFSSIISIKKTSTKVNGERYWKMVYLDEFRIKHNCRFFSSFNKEFHTRVRTVNPDVVIWTHPFFNH